MLERMESTLKTHLDEILDVKLDVMSHVTVDTTSGHKQPSTMQPKTPISFPTQNDDNFADSPRESTGDDGSSSYSFDAVEVQDDVSLKDDFCFPEAASENHRSIEANEDTDAAEEGEKGKVIDAEEDTWEVHIDERTGFQFYHNRRRNLSQWHPPTSGKIAKRPSVKC